MGRKKERMRIIHESSTHEIFHCLSTMPSYSKILLDQCPDKAYSNFLSWLIDKNFFKGLEERITIKRMSAEFRASVEFFLVHFIDDLKNTNNVQHMLCCSECMDRHTCNVMLIYFGC